MSEYPVDIQVSSPQAGVSVNNNGVTISYGQTIDTSNFVTQADYDAHTTRINENLDGIMRNAGNISALAANPPHQATMSFNLNSGDMRTFYPAVELDRVYYLQLVCNNTGDQDATFQIQGLNFQVNGIYPDANGFSNVKVTPGATNTYAVIGSVAYEVLDNRTLKRTLMPGVRVGTTPTDAEMEQDAVYFTFYNPADGNVSLRLRIKDNPADPGFAPFAGMVWESPMYALGKM